jgi:hypothetical protein
VEDMGLEEASLLDTWYRPDHNAIPPVSILQPIDSILGKDEGLLQVFASLMGIISLLSVHPTFTDKNLSQPASYPEDTMVVSVNENRIATVHLHIDNFTLLTIFTRKFFSSK